MLIEGSCGYFDSASENTWKSDGDFILRWLGIRCEGKTGNTFGWGIRGDLGSARNQFPDLPC